MKALMVFAAILFAQTAFAAKTLTCAPVGSPETRVTFTIVRGKVTQFATTLGQRESMPFADKDNGVTAEYSFLVDDFYDTLKWIVVEIARDNSIVSAREWISGNDSDNYVGSATQTQIQCQ